MALIDADLSFDPRDPHFPLPGTDVRWAVQVFTTGNGYGLDPASCHVQDGRLRCDRLALLGGQRTAAGGVEVELRTGGDRAEWTISVDHPEPVKAVKLLLTGLPDEPWWAPNTGRGHELGGRFQLDYPGPEWATPWAASGDVALSVRDPLVRRQVLHVHRPAYAPGRIVELVHLPAASARTTHHRVPPIRLRRGGLDADLDEHLSFVERAHQLVPWEQRTDVPDWLRDVALVVTLHGQHWTGHVFNTFPAMAEALRFLSGHVEPHRVLAYLPGWEGRYYHDYPRYRPGADLGGDAGFHRLADAARELGVRLMPMFGGHGANVTAYPDWERSVIRNDTGRYAELLNRPDWDGDRTGEGDQVFLNPGEPRFRAHLVDSVSAVVREFGVDAAFFDTLGYWFNDPRYELVDGYRRLVAELRDRHPELLLAAEGWWDALSALFPLSQQWFGVDRDLREPRVLTRYARTTGHLAEGTPGPGSTGVHEKGFVPRPADVARPGHIPVVGIVGDTLAEHADEVAAIARWAQAHPPR
ncbi:MULTISPECIES: hypothetical protein [unclassified Saccharopolyspora]|uniref:hypothetical protein n=1 Tax=unclassified Saccharopolyspora TaxID=2646250 RepID=UPI001CD36C9D|nr:MULTISPECIES: hypothetical protein [unclassified Saccharopolyspora]MCA1226079.1 hypothetical protein [Saccharopolyspora sp. 6M]MCA1280213.1 hypothetical protein [Saccharopolyspora sp. 7B]